MAPPGRSRQVAATGAVLILVFFTTAAQDNDQSGPTPGPAYVEVTGPSSSGESLHVLNVGPVSEGFVDISDLKVDANCAKGTYHQPSTEGLRENILRAGCAKIVGIPRSASEAQAQEDAKSEQVGIWNPGLWAKTKRGAHSFAGWFTRNFLAILAIIGTIGTILSIGLVGKGIERLLAKQKERHLHIILAGAPGAGKTDLWKALQSRENKVPQTGSRPSVGEHEVTLPSISSVRYGDYTLYPHVKDVAGTEPWRLMDNLAISANRREKRILICVLAPRPEDKVNGQSIDRSYVDKQEGYTNLVAALVGSSRLGRLDMLVIFVSKFDLLSRHSPGDTSSQQEFSTIENTFAHHRAMAYKACKHANVEFRFHIGSSKEGWGVRDDLRNDLEDVMRS